MKYYIYISEEKLHMLYPQTRQGKMARLLSKANLQIPTPVGKVNIQEKDSTEDIIPVLEKTISYLQRLDLIGSIERPKEYIHDVVELQSGIPVAKRFGEQSKDIVDAVLWGNRSIPFVLVGSRKHLIGESIKTRERGSSFSQLRHIIGLVETMQCEGVFYKNLRNLPPEVTNAHWLERDWMIDRATVQDLCRFLCRVVSGPYRSYEFVARVLLIEFGKRQTTIIGTPLYVALSGL